MAPVAITEAQRQRSKLSADVKKLPSELVATDVQDADKVHSNDAPHIIKGLLKKLAREQAQGFKTPPPVIVKSAAGLRFAAMCHDLNDKLPLQRKAIDIIRAKLLANLACKVLANKSATALDFRVRHVWFPRYARGPEAGASAFELRDGPAPLDSARPEQLRKLDLNVDVLAWPEAVEDDLDPVAFQLSATTAWLHNVWNRVRLGMSPTSPLILPPSFQQ